MNVLLFILLSSSPLILRGPGFERQLSLEDLRAFPEERIALSALNEREAGSLAGPDLRVVLFDLGIDTTSIDEIVLRSSDGYRANLFQDVLHDCRVLLLYDLTGTPFAGSGPIYSVMPGCPEMLWVKDLREVEVLYAGSLDSLKAVHIMSPEIVLARALPVEMDGMTFWGLPFGALGPTRGRIEVRSRDGLERRYSPQAISEEGWMIADYHGRGFDFIARDVPRGVWMRDIELIVFDGEAFFFPPTPGEGDPIYRRTLADLFPYFSVELRSIEIRSGALISELQFEDSPLHLSDIVLETGPEASLRVVIGDAAFEHVVRVSLR